VWGTVKGVTFLGYLVTLSHLQSFIESKGRSIVNDEVEKMEGSGRGLL
jgi:hypothetical protein